MSHIKHTHAYVIFIVLTIVIIVIIISSMGQIVSLPLLAIAHGQ